MKITQVVANAFQVGFIAFTRAANVASGDVSYTGAGFKPKAIFIFGGWTGHHCGSWGFAKDTDERVALWFDWYDYDVKHTEKLINMVDGDGDGQRAELKSIDDDGFSLTWTKVNTGVGTMNLYAMCFR